MSNTVPSVNKDETTEIENAGSEEQWVDPIFAEKAAATLPDDPDNLTELDSLDTAEEAAEGKEPTPEQIAALLKRKPGKEENAEEAAPEGADDESEDDDDEPAEEAAADGPESEAEGKNKEKPARKPRRRSQARRERRKMQREMTALREELADLKKGAQPEPAEEAAPEEASEPPKIEDFDYDPDEWSKAIGEWQKSEIAKATGKQEEAAQAKVAEEAEKARQDLFSDFTATHDAARDKYGDDEFDDAYEKAALLQISDGTVDIIMGSDVGADIVYHLGINEEYAAKLEGMTEVQVALEIGRLEAKLLNPAEQADPAPDGESGEPEGEQPEPDATAEKATEGEQPEPEPKPVTQAPAPVPTISGTGSSSARNPSKMDQDEYNEARRAGQIR